MLGFWRDLSVSRKLYAVVGVMALLIAVEMATLQFSMRTLSAVRAFSAAQGIWSKAEKSAVQYLQLYALTREEHYYQSFTEQLRIPMGDRRARQELNKPDMDMGVVLDGFLQGQNHLDDIESMVSLVRRFRAVPQFDRAIEKWQEGDELITEIIRAAENLHLEILKGEQSDQENIKRLLSHIENVDDRLTLADNEFSLRLSEASRWLEQILTILLLLAVVAIEGTGLFLTIRIARGLTKGLNELSEAANKVGEGDFSPTVPVRSRDELGRLSLALNKMTSSLRHQVSVRQTAEHASETKNLFLANMSHEIRTPLNAILGFSELLADPKLTQDERERYAAIVKRTGASLTTIINDILDISRVEADQVEIDIEPFSLSQMLSDLRALLLLRCEEKGIQLNFVKKGEVAERIYSDPTRFRQILANIIGNSIKFTDKGSVTLTYEVNGEHLHFLVRDTGSGVPPERMSRLFKPFSQGDDSVRKKYGGTGLGLMISQRLARLLGGDVGLSAHQPEKGSEFFIKVKYQPAEAIHSEEHKLEPPSDSTLLGKRLLVVEDSTDNQLLAKLYLSRAGAHVFFANNGKIGVEMALREKFDLILMDMQMPVMDGYLATSELRRSGVQIPIIALTGFAMKEDREQCLRAGCTSYLTKPIERDKLLATVKRHLESEGTKPAYEDREPGVAASGFLIALLAMMGFMWPQPSRAETGVTANSVTIGIVTSLSGSVGRTGELILAGHKAAFQRVNSAGGIYGRKLEIKSLDDSYVPAKTVELTSQMINEKTAFLLTGFNGTATTKAVLPLIRENGMPFLFPRTGDLSVRGFTKNLFNFRPSFDDEIKVLVRYGLSGGRTRMGILYQADPFGDSLRSSTIGVIQSMKNSSRVVAAAGIPREATDAKYIQDAYDRIGHGKPETVLLATSLPLSAPFVKMAHDAGQKYLFLGVSSTNNLADKLMDLNSVEVIFSQVVPNPYDAEGIPLVGEYLADMKTAGLEKDIGFSSFEYYVTARVIAEALRRAGSDLTREKFIRSLEDKPFSIGGINIQWSATDHNAKPSVYLTKFAQKKFVTVAADGVLVSASGTTR